MVEGEEGDGASVCNRRGAFVRRRSSTAAAALTPGPCMSNHPHCPSTHTAACLQTHPAHPKHWWQGVEAAMCGSSTSATAPKQGKGDSRSFLFPVPGRLSTGQAAAAQIPCCGESQEACLQHSMVVLGARACMTLPCMLDQRHTQLPSRKLLSESKAPLEVTERPRAKIPSARIPTKTPLCLVPDETSIAPHLLHWLTSGSIDEARVFESQGACCLKAVFPCTHTKHDFILSFDNAGESQKGRHGKCQILCARSCVCEDATHRSVLPPLLRTHPCQST